jgi:predicted phage-related endonuclease
MRPARTLHTHADWLAARRIGASDVAKILGVSTWGTGWDVWTRLTGQAPPRGPETVDQARGHLWEPVVIDLYRRQFGVDARPAPAGTIIDGPEAWSTISPDGFVFDDVGVGLLEAKTDRVGGHWGESTEIERWTPACEELVRPDYALQCYAQMFGADVPFVDLVVLLPFYELRAFRLWRDLEVEAELVAELRGWWERHIVGGEPPEVDGSKACAAWVSERFRTPAPPRPATPGELELAARIGELDAQTKAARAERDELANRLLLSMDGAKSLDLSDLAPRAKAVAVAPSTSTTLDVRALEAAHPDLDLSPFRRTSQRSAHVRFYHLPSEE